MKMKREKRTIRLDESGVRALVKSMLSEMNRGYRGHRSHKDRGEVYGPQDRAGVELMPAEHRQNLALGAAADMLGEPDPEALRAEWTEWYAGLSPHGKVGTPGELAKRFVRDGGGRDPMMGEAVSLDEASLRRLVRGILRRD
jgi:hypothetical protein